MKSNGFEMKVSNIFHLQGGHTVFVGSILEEIEFIAKCRVEVILDGKFYKNITIDGEWITERALSNDVRAISTTEPIDLTEQVISQKECRLKQCDRSC